LIRDAAGSLYGTTRAGGPSQSIGVVFKLSPAGIETVLHGFTGGGDGPYAGLIEDAAGNLYGTTQTCGAGQLFKLSPTGTYTVLHSFLGPPTDGSGPYGDLVRDAAGNLYGTTYFGGAFTFGAVFELSPTGTETVLYSFTGGADGFQPRAGLVQDAAGNLYGTTTRGGFFSNACGTGCGVVFKLTP
jgi:uncharacterized repeat protein (TIGR03803 family)